jgi:hypothetical protein
MMNMPALCQEYSENLLAIDVNVDTTTMLNIAWSLFSKHFNKSEVGSKTNLLKILAQKLISTKLPWQSNFSTIKRHFRH